MRLCIEAIPTQNVIPRSPNENVYQNVRQILFAVLDEFEIFFQIRRIDWQGCFIVLVEELDLVVNVPCAFVSRRRREKTTALTGRQKALEYSITLRVCVPKVVTFVEQDEIAIAVFRIVEPKIY
jgi:hypothetical protein